MTNPLNAQHRKWEQGISGAISAPTEVKSASIMGKVTVEPFDPSWLESHPMVLDHVYSEHALHVKGVDDEAEGLTWHAAKFNATSHNPTLNPESHFQMKVGYFLIPQSFLIQKASTHLPQELVANQIYQKIEGEFYVKFFVHPDAYEHYSPLMADATLIQDAAKVKSLTKTDFSGKNMIFVSSEASSVMGTPTSSYRSWVVCDRESDVPTPFIMKVGVPCEVLGSDRWLSEAEIERSVNCQMAFDSLKDDLATSREGCRFTVFPESLGMTIAHPLYRDAHSKHSGMLIREFPQELLEGKVRIASCAALMSTEAARSGSRPWICDIIDASIESGECLSAKEFIEKHFVENYLEAIDPVILGQGMTIEPHSQNLCVLLSNQLQPKILGFAYRDHGGIWVDLASRVMKDQRVDFFACNMMTSKSSADQTATILPRPAAPLAKTLVKAQGAVDRAYIQSFAWFYRYQVLIKLFNSVLDSKEGSHWMPSGAPHQIGLEEVIPERILANYVVSHIEAYQTLHPEGGVEEEKQIDATAERVLSIAKKIFPHALTRDDAEELLEKLDTSYVRRLDRYFVAGELANRLPMPAAEGGAGREKEKVVTDYHKFFGHWQKADVNSKMLNLCTDEVFDKIDVREAITYDGMPFNRSQATHFLEKSSGFIFYKLDNDKLNLIAIIPKIK